MHRYLLPGLVLKLSQLRPFEEPVRICKYAEIDFAMNSRSCLLLPGIRTADRSLDMPPGFFDASASILPLPSLTGALVVGKFFHVHILNLTMARKLPLSASFNKLQPVDLNARPLQIEHGMALKILLHAARRSLHVGHLDLAKAQLEGVSSELLNVSTLDPAELWPEAGHLITVRMEQLRATEAGLDKTALVNDSNHLMTEMTFQENLFVLVELASDLARARDDDSAAEALLDCEKHFAHDDILAIQEHDRHNMKRYVQMSVLEASNFMCSVIGNVLDRQKLPHAHSRLVNHHFAIVEGVVRERIKFYIEGVSAARFDQHAQPLAKSLDKNLQCMRDCFINLLSMAFDGLAHGSSDETATDELFLRFNQLYGPEVESLHALFAFLGLPLTDVDLPKNHKLLEPVYRRHILTHIRHHEVSPPDEVARALEQARACPLASRAAMLRTWLRSLHYLGDEGVRVQAAQLEQHLYVHDMAVALVAQGGDDTHVEARLALFDAIEVRRPARFPPCPAPQALSRALSYPNSRSRAVRRRITSTQSMRSAHWRSKSRAT